MNKHFTDKIKLVISYITLSSAIMISACSYQPDISYNDGSSDPLTNLVNTFTPAGNKVDKKDELHTKNSPKNNSNKSYAFREIIWIKRHQQIHRGVTL